MVEWETVGWVEFLSINNSSNNNNRTATIAVIQNFMKTHLLSKCTLSKITINQDHPGTNL